MDGKNNEPREPKEKVISDEFRVAINTAAKRPLQIMATAVNYKIRRLERVIKGEILNPRDIWPLLRIVQFIEFKGEFFKKV